jgi:hypothetical protein
LQRIALGAVVAQRKEDGYRGGVFDAEHATECKRKVEFDPGPV